MIVVKSDLDLDAYKDQVLKMQWVKDGTGILMANGQWRGVPQDGWDLWVAAFEDLCRSVARTFGQEVNVLAGTQLHHVMVNAIPPGGDSGWHVDPDPGRRFSRWHLPITSNDGCLFLQKGEIPVRMGIGWWHGPIEYWHPHRVLNGGKTGRCHLILDVLSS